MSNIPIGFGRLGGLIYSNVILDGSGSSLGALGAFVTGTIGTVAEELTRGLTINDCLVGVTNTKNIVTTPISGRNGTVKEYINRGDYQISIYGMIMANTDNVFPTARVRKFYEICEKEEAISISSAFLNHANITTVVITDYKISEKMGVRNGVPFSLTLLSDDPIEIKVNA
jgi:hypothetical protein